MKVYLEIEEKLTDEEFFSKQPEFFRKEVGSEEEARTLYDSIKELFVGSQARIHLCNHDTNTPCTIIKIGDEE